MAFKVLQNNQNNYQFQKPKSLNLRLKSNSIPAQSDVRTKKVTEPEIYSMVQEAKTAIRTKKGKAFFDRFALLSAIKETNKDLKQPIPIPKLQVRNPSVDVMLQHLIDHENSAPKDKIDKYFSHTLTRYKKGLNTSQTKSFKYSYVNSTPKSKGFSTNLQMLFPTSQTTLSLANPALVMNPTLKKLKL